jgi:hypothetical protein
MVKEASVEPLSTSACGFHLLALEPLATCEPSPLREPCPTVNRRPPPRPALAAGHHVHPAPGWPGPGRRQVEPPGLISASLPLFSFNPGLQLLHPPGSPVRLRMSLSSLDLAWLFSGRCALRRENVEGEKDGQVGPEFLM